MQLIWKTIKDQGTISVAVAGDSWNGILHGSSEDVTRVAVTPVQLHFHDTSEHTFDGAYVRAQHPVLLASNRSLLVIVCVYCNLVHKLRYRMGRLCTL